MTELILAIAILIGLVAVSYLAEALRPAPKPPTVLAWAPDIPIRSTTVGGVRLRYIVAGDGPPLVLLHTLRTQLDMFQRVIPELARRFRVHALDYPGHAYSDIPAVSYSADYFVGIVGEFLEQLGLRDAVLVGESIGGSIALVLAARKHRGVGRVLAINPYDYDGGRGLRRASLLANILFGVNNVPVLGGTVTRLRLYPIVKAVLEGGLARKSSLPVALARELYRVGNRPGHYRAFMALVHQWPSWERARAEYGNIDLPVLLLYGDRDWSRPAEREANARLIPGARTRVVPAAGHFLSLDAPEAIVTAVAELTAGNGEWPAGTPSLARA
jgi:pimeloyl-ACP methyl ester carboxylesterase